MATQQYTTAQELKKASSKPKDSAKFSTEAQEIWLKLRALFDHAGTNQVRVAPSAVGQAPLFSQGTGDPIFSTLWTLAGLPCITLPLLVGKNGLPVGVQLIGPIEKDDRLLRTANWLQEFLSLEATE